MKFSEKKRNREGEGGQIDPQAFLGLKTAISYTAQVINIGLLLAHWLHQKR